jgi:hypothetical protein
VRRCAPGELTKGGMLSTSTLRSLMIVPDSR